VECAFLFHKICGNYYYKKGVYIQVITSTGRCDDLYVNIDNFEGGIGNTVPHENVYIQNANLLKTLEIPEI